MNPIIKKLNSKIASHKREIEILQAARKAIKELGPIPRKKRPAKVK